MGEAGCPKAMIRYMSIKHGFLGQMAGDMSRECGFVAHIVVLRLPISGPSSLPLVLCVDTKRPTLGRPSI